MVWEMVLRSEYARNYLFTALQSGPELLTLASKNLSDVEADHRGDPDRFTIREVIAHLADWEPIFLSRMERMLNEDFPFIPGLDPSDLARDNHYAVLNPQEQLQRFAAGRAANIAFLRSITPEQMERAADRPEIGMMTIADVAMLMPLHDIYHLKQVSELRSSFRAQ